MLTLRNWLVVLALALAIPAAAQYPGLMAPGGSGGHGGGSDAVLYEQAWDGSSPGVVAQDFYQDYPTYSTQEFDDFTVPSPGWIVERVTVFGVEYGNPGMNAAVYLRFQNNYGVEAWSGYTGTQVGNDLVFTFRKGDLVLQPGTYWITAWVKRNFGGGGGQWFWLRTTPVNGSEHYFHNPGNGFGYGGNPIPGSRVFGSPADLAFRIEGQVIPEPASLIALGSGLVGLIALRRRKR